ncbi:MAG: DegT/DnrJ/EryC1/StrS family aminotransferase [Anaerolineae bacterium]
MRDTFLPFSPPCLGEEEIAEVVDTLRSDWITTGPKVKRFEEAFAAFVGAPAALALSSGTDAMLVALAALGVGPGDAVITTPMTFCSTVHVIEHLGATPILVDVEPDTLNLDPRKVEEALSQWEDRPRIADRGLGQAAVGGQPSAVGGRIKVLLPVHLYGHPCDMDALREVARAHDLAIVEDAAHALPAKYKGRTIGSLPTADDGPQTAVGGPPSAVCFSFYATKNLTTAEGGMLTGPVDLVEEARIWSLHGMSRDAWKRYSAEGSWYYEVVRPGFKCNMTDIQAAIGLHQLAKLPRFQARRREIVQRYNEAFSQLEELQVPIERPEVEHAWHLYVLRLNLERFQPSAVGGQPSAVRNRFIEELRARNIGTSVHFIPVHLHPYYRDRYGYRPEDFPVAYREYQRIVSLPLYPRMTDQDVQDVIDAVVEIVKRYRR